MSPRNAWTGFTGISSTISPGIARARRDELLTPDLRHFIQYCPHRIATKTSHRNNNSTIILPANLTRGKGPAARWSQALYRGAYLVPPARPMGAPAASAAIPTRGLAAAAPAGPGATSGTGGGAPGSTGIGAIGTGGTGPGSPIGTTGAARVVRSAAAGPQGAPATTAVVSTSVASAGAAAPAGPTNAVRPPLQIGPPTGSGAIDGAAAALALKISALAHKPIPANIAIPGLPRLFNANSDCSIQPPGHAVFRLRLEPYHSGVSYSARNVIRYRTDADQRR